MITNLAQMEGALRQIAWAADALEGIRRDVNEENALVFPAVAESYLHHIREMTAEARAYLQARPELADAQPQENGLSPADASQIQGWSEKMTAA